MLTKTEPKKTSLQSKIQNPKSKIIWVVLLFGFLTLLYTWRLWGNLATVAPGGDVDGFENVWNNWWVRTALLDLHRNPLFTDYIYYPSGVSLRLHALQPLNGLFTLLLAPFFGAVAATNLTFIWAIFSTALFSYFLFYYLTENAFAALAGSCFFGFCNWQQYEFFAAGQGNLVSLEWLPLYLLFMLKVARDEGRRWLNIGLAVLWLFCLTLTDLQYLLFAVMLTGLYALYCLFKRQSWRAKAFMWGRLALVGGLYGLVALPTLLIPAAIEASQSPWLWPKADQSTFKSADLLDFVGWSAHNLGYIPLGLAILGLVVGWRKTGDDLRFLGLIALIFGGLALGPVLQVGDQPLKIGDKAIILPYRWLSELPGMQVGRNPSLYQVVWMLAVAAMAAFGVRWLINYLLQRTQRNLSPKSKVEEIGAGRWLVGSKNAKIQSSKSKTIILCALCGLILLAVLPLLLAAAGSYKLDALDVPPFYEQLAQDKADYAILEVPSFTYKGRGEDVYQGYQTIHHKRRFGGRLSRDHKLDNPNNFIKGNTLFRNFFWLGEERAPDFRPAKDFVTIPAYKDIGLPLLNFYNVRYIVFYKEAQTEADTKVAQDLVNEVLGNPQPYYEDKRLKVYSVPQAAPYTANAGLFIDTGDGWYQPESQRGETWRWAKQPDNVQLYVYNMTQGAQTAKLGLLAYSFKTNRDLIVNLNGHEIGRYSLIEERQAFNFDLKLEPGRNLLTFSSPQPALSVADFGFKNDSRVLSFGMLNLELQQVVGGS